MSKQRHILITRLSAMGDVAMAMPVVYAFVKAYPDVKVSFLSKAFHRPIVEAIPNISFITAQVKTTHKGISGMWKLSRELKRLRISEVADLHNVIRTKMLIRFLGLPAVKIDKGRAEKKALINGNVENFIPLQTTVERYVEVFEKIGYTGLKPLTLPIPQKTDSLLEFTEDTAQKWIGIAPFAAHAGKQYPKQLMKQIINELDQKLDYTLFLFGAPSELELLKEFAQGCNQTRIVASKLSFPDEINLIAQLDGMLSMDSGNGHLAAMYGVPTITLWGVTHPYAGFAPVGQEQNVIVSDRNKFPLIPTSIYGNVIPKGYEEVMHTIRPQTVVQKVITTVG